MTTAEPALNFVHCPDRLGGHAMAYWQWGDIQAPHVIVCLHGLSRQGRDFDVLARALLAAARTPLRIVCPDIVGRGRSDWLKEPTAYQIPTYALDLLTLLHALHRQAPIAVLDWFGTSMGGLIGLSIAGTPDAPLPAPVRRLVLNDVGPTIAWDGLQRIGTYLGRADRFESVQQAADAMWAVSTSFGPHTPEQWAALSAPMVKPLPGGGVALHYDPAIALPFRGLTREDAANGQSALWQCYDRITATTLLTRGALSDLLTHETALAMAGRGPRARLVEFDGVGHAPTFVSAEQVAVATAFLLGDPPAQ